MEQLRTRYSIALHEEHCELHFRIAGYWEADAIRAFQDELSLASYPLYKAGKPIHVLGDMADFVPQSRETADMIRKHLEFSRSYGLKKVAILNPSSLVRDQYRRVSKGIEVQFFENRIDAIAWLRGAPALMKEVG
jgi:hypothetical protein